MECPSDRPIPCAVGGLLEILARPWTMHILWVLGTDGPTRFGVLRRKISGISSRVLTERLRALEGRGFVYRQYAATIPPAVTYGLTNRMKDMQPVMAELDRLAQRWYEEDSAPKETPVQPEAG
jgi:DNA-binding HxlR family transcriptional regulator